MRVVGGVSSGEGAQIRPRDRVQQIGSSRYYVYDQPRRGFLGKLT